MCENNRFRIDKIGTIPTKPTKNYKNGTGQNPILSYPYIQSPIWIKSINPLVFKQREFSFLFLKMISSQVDS